ncbi:DUF2975 domain-containing protein [uncultured Dokdonia sp.]|uniref:DUF2975 domain-containing protein n=1 Tax=uncultured Dokdonia sp. TaxID=575653 RepID=UPI00260D8700|nr:DUF2975 domain-containing protein [uncultured Dokdonia sp.]
MVKIKILLGIITLLIVVYILHFLSYFFLADYFAEISKSTESKIVFGKYNLVIGLIQSIVIFFGLIISFKCMYEIIKRGFFTKTSKKLMYVAGIIFLFSGLVALSLDSIRLFNSANQGTLIGILFMDFLLALIGFIILIISEMSCIGFEIKSENDLTI